MSKTTSGGSETATTALRGGQRKDDSFIPMARDPHPGGCETVEGYALGIDLIIIQGEITGQDLGI
jgi:hypothetical protein